MFHNNIHEDLSIVHGGALQAGVPLIGDFNTIPIGLHVCLVLGRKLALLRSSSLRHAFLHTDEIFLDILSCFMLDQIVQWGALAECAKPIHAWLAGAYVLMWASCLMVRTFQRRLAAGSDCLRKYSQSSNDKAVSLAFATTWGALLPLFIFWGLLGGFWLFHVMDDSPHCLRGAGHHSVAFVIGCLSLCLLAVV